MHNNTYKRLFMMINLLLVIASSGLSVAASQVVLLAGTIDNGTCDLGMKAGQSATVDFHAIPYATFAQAGASSALPAGSNTGTVQHFSLALTNCHTAAGGNQKPGIQVDSADYHTDGAYSQLWRGMSSTAQGVGYLVQFANVTDAAPANWWNAPNNVKGNDIPYQGTAGSAQPDTLDIPFSVVMSCGLCKTEVTGGQVNASLSFTFAYR